CGAALPQIDAAGAGLAIEIILADQPLSGQPPIDRRRAGATCDRLILRTLRQIKLNDDNAISHGSRPLELTFGPRTRRSASGRSAAEPGPIVARNVDPGSAAHHSMMLRRVRGTI